MIVWRAPAFTEDLVPALVAHPGCWVHSPRPKARARPGGPPVQQRTNQISSMMKTAVSSAVLSSAFLSLSARTVLHGTVLHGTVLHGTVLHGRSSRCRTGSPPVSRAHSEVAAHPAISPPPGCAATYSAMSAWISLLTSVDLRQRKGKAVKGKESSEIEGEGVAKDAPAHLRHHLRSELFRPCSSVDRPWLNAALTPARDPSSIASSTASSTCIKHMHQAHQVHASSTCIKHMHHTEDTNGSAMARGPQTQPTRHTSTDSRAGALAPSSVSGSSPSSSPPAPTRDLK